MQISQFTTHDILLTYIMCLFMVCQRGHGCIRDYPLSRKLCQNAALHYKLTEQVWKQKDVPIFGDDIQIINDTIRRNSSACDKRVVGGERVDISEYPYQVALLVGGDIQCGGSIISENFVLTAAHCIMSSQGRGRVRAGSSKHFEGGVLHDSKWEKEHPQYKGDNFDIGLICLETPFQFGRLVQPVALIDEGSSLPVGQYGVVTGWGRIREDGRLSSHLRKVRVPIYSMSDCKTAFGWMISHTMFCAGYPLGQIDACTGDSGGALVVGNAQFGIVSWGVGCARPMCPGVYINIAKVRRWIAVVTGV